MSETQMVHKVVLSSGKVVLFREMEMRHEELATQIASGKAGENMTMVGYYMQNELVKLLIAGFSKTTEAKPKKLSATETEDLSSIFSYTDITQMRKVVGKLMGEDSAKELPIEMISSGGL